LLRVSASASWSTLFAESSTTNLNSAVYNFIYFTNILYIFKLIIEFWKSKVLTSYSCAINMCSYGYLENGPIFFSKVPCALKVSTKSILMLQNIPGTLNILLIC
jgi:hypothetical protein